MIKDGEKMSSLAEGITYLLSKSKDIIKKNVQPITWLLATDEKIIVIQKKRIAKFMEFGHIISLEKKGSEKTICFQHLPPYEYFALSDGAVEYVDCTTARGKTPSMRPPVSRG